MASHFLQITTEKQSTQLTTSLTEIETTSDLNNLRDTSANENEVLVTENVNDSLLSSQQNEEVTTDTNHLKQIVTEDNASGTLDTEIVEESTLSYQKNEEAAEEIESGEPLFLPLISSQDQTVRENGLERIENNVDDIIEPIEVLENNFTSITSNTSESVTFENKFESNIDFPESKSSEALEFLSKITEIIRPPVDDHELEHEIVLLDDNKYSEQETTTTVQNVHYAMEDVEDKDVVIEIVPLALPIKPISSNETLYRFIFPVVEDNPVDNPMDKFKYNWIEEHVLVNDGGVPKECTIHVDKVSHIFVFIYCRYDVIVLTL